MPEEADAEVLRRALERERARRRKAEDLLENKSRELYEASEALREALTDLQANQKQLVHSEKMASLGVLSAGVAHEINNPIGFVLSNVNTLADYVKIFQHAYDLVRTALVEGRDVAETSREFIAFSEAKELDYLVEDTAELIRDTRAGLIRVKDIVQDLRNFARDDDTSMASLDLNEAVRSALVMARSEVGSRQLDVALEPLPLILGNLGKLSQVVLNLVVNASHATADDGRIRVATRADGRSAVLEVEDDGCGIPEENLDKLFTPFFTTKPQGVGTGLGLSISHGIVAEHGGELSVTSREGEGTCFEVRIPLE